MQAIKTQQSNLWLHWRSLLLLLWNLIRSVDAFSKQAMIPHVVVVGGGISGLVVGHVLQQSGKYNVTVVEAQPQLGGHVRSLPDVQNHDRILNIGHATHMGMFVNLRLMLRHFGISEWPVGKGPNHEPSIFRMLNLAISDDSALGCRIQPPLEDVLSLQVWWEALRFYWDSYQDPYQSLGDYLQTRTPSRKFSRFCNILFWAMSTFEFDKREVDMKKYCMGAARALLITQVFFQYLLCDSFCGRLPPKIDNGLKADLEKRIEQTHSHHGEGATKSELEEGFYKVTDGAPLASYFSADYNEAVDKLAHGIGRVLTDTAVVDISKAKSYSKARRSEESTTLQQTLLKVKVLHPGHQEYNILEAHKIVFTTHPSIVSKVLDEKDFYLHQQILKKMDSGAVGVRILNANSLPFVYPPKKDQPIATYECNNSISRTPACLGIFDISELTRCKSTAGRCRWESTEATNHNQTAGWLSVAYPVYFHTAPNVHKRWLKNNVVDYVDDAVYPWTIATPSFAEARRNLTNSLQGKHGVYIIGQALTGVNKASELQVTNALKLCDRFFGVRPPWHLSYLYPMLPDCNDDDAFYQAQNAFECFQLAAKSLIGSFVLTGIVKRFGTNFLK